MFPGTWSDGDCYYAVKKVLGHEAEYLWHRDTDKLTTRFDCVILPGGFSYGDYLRAGAIARFSPVMEAVKDFAAGAPAFGMVGTLGGLNGMLGAMGGSPEDLGAGLAVAMLTTLYGVLFARVLFLPAASKMQQREQIFKFRNSILVEGFALLAEKKSPRFMQDALNAFLDPSIHYDIDAAKE